MLAYSNSSKRPKFCVLFRLGKHLLWLYVLFSTIIKVWWLFPHGSENVLSLDPHASPTSPPHFALGNSPWKQTVCFPWLLCLLSLNYCGIQWAQSLSFKVLQCLTVWSGLIIKEWEEKVKFWWLLISKKLAPVYYGVPIQCSHSCHKFSNCNGKKKIGWFTGKSIIVAVTVFRYMS